MRRAWSHRLAPGEAGFTLIELLVASTMAVIVMSGVATLVMSAVRGQPEISKRAQNVSTARWVLERLTREIRNGIAVAPGKATASEVSFRTYVRASSCTTGGTPGSATPAIECQVTYKCATAGTATCTRTQSAPNTYTGTATTIISGLSSSSVFGYTPDAEEPTYIEISLQLPNPSGGGKLTVTDGASLRNATLTK
jgi:prepilin-type N-terminal cleavage/methylation domain-containing protein